MNRDKLLNWYFEHRRELPWRKNRSPYRVWISEVMLQQTQVRVVLPYFERWMEHFPTIRDLAKSNIDRVLKVWEGLGYYSRARRLHRAAKEIVERFNGELPRDPKQLATIQGLGPYTVGALLNFAFQQTAPAIDGNVMRVIARYLRIEAEIHTAKAKQQVETLIRQQAHRWEFAEALIELGALVCTKKPHCHQCPLAEECQAFQQGETDLFPRKKARETTIHLVRHVAVIAAGECLYLQQGKKREVMEGLYEFPYTESEDFHAHFEKALGFSLKYRYPLEKQVHTFTKYRAQLLPHYFEAEKKGKGWKTKREIATLPFSSGHKRILESL